MKKREYELEMVEKFLASGKGTYCPTRTAKGTKPIVCINKRSKKNLTYSDAPMGIRCMNFESIYNIPSVYDGVKMFMGREGTTAGTTPEILK